MKKIHYQIIGVVAHHAKHILSIDSTFLLTQVRYLAKNHQVQCEYACSGEGVLPAGVLQGFRGFIKTDDKRAWVADESVFDIAAAIIEVKINKIIRQVEELESKRMDVVYQYDPRGETVRITIQGIDITEVLYV